jgi:hypothetical protein
VALLVFLGMNVRDIAADIGLVKSQLDSTNSIIEKRQAERQELTEGIASMEQELEALASDRTVYEAALSDIYARGDLINGDMEAAVDNWVSGIDFYLIAHNYDDITISGQAPSEQEVLEYVRRLDATGRFAELTIDRLYLDDVCDALSEVMDFTLTLQLEEEE